MDVAGKSGVCREVTRFASRRRSLSLRTACWPSRGGHHDFRSRNAPQRQLLLRRRSLKPNPQPLMLVLEFVQAVLIHETEQLLDFRKTSHGSAFAIAFCGFLFVCHLESEKFPGSSCQ